MFRGCFKGVSKVFQGCLKDVSWKFHESFKGFSGGVSSNIDQCFEVDLRVFQGSFKGILSVF